MSKMVSERSKQSLAYALVAMSGTLIVADGVQESEGFWILAGGVLAVTALGLLVYTVQ